MKTMKSIKCIIPNCFPCLDEQNLSYHKIPIESNARKKWILLLKEKAQLEFDTNIKSKYKQMLCSKHFCNYQYPNNTKGKKLKSSSFPCTFFNENGEVNKCECPSSMNKKSCNSG